MAKTVLGYFKNIDQALLSMNHLIKEGYEPGSINIIYQNQQKGEEQQNLFDTTFEEGPVAEYKVALFQAEITEEDAEYYQTLLERGHALIAVYVPTNQEEGRLQELEAAGQLCLLMRLDKAYDREIRSVYSNQGGLTTYPQNRYTDPARMLNSKDQIYRSASSLGQELSNMLGMLDPGDARIVNVGRGGREVKSGIDSISQFYSEEAELLKGVRNKASS